MSGALSLKLGQQRLLLTCPQTQARPLGPVPPLERVFRLIFTAPPQGASYLGTQESFGCGVEGEVAV